MNTIHKKAQWNELYGYSKRKVTWIIPIVIVLFLILVVFWDNRRELIGQLQKYESAKSSPSGPAASVLLRGNANMATDDLFKSLFLQTEELRKNGDQRTFDGAVRAELSLMLNHALKKIGQLTCEKTNQAQSAAGGWCSPHSGRTSSNHMFDENLARELSKTLQGKRVASFGDGPGMYKEKLLEWKQVASYDAFDGAPYAENTTNNIVQFLDLTAPIYHLDKYDWIVSLEVAEHIPAPFESIYLDNIKRHASEGIILSWAKIGQGGFMHVNCRNMDYVIEVMEMSKEFKYDEPASIRIREASSFPWFRSNIAVFNRIRAAP